MKELEQVNWIKEWFTNHEIFKDEDSICGLSDDYTEIFIYRSSLSNEPVIRIQNVEMVNETIFVCQMPGTKTGFDTLMEAAGFIKG